MRTVSTLIAALSFGILVNHGCAPQREPELEQWRGEEFHPLPIESYELIGQRDGAVTTATVALTTSDGSRVEVRLQIQYDPAPSLRSGSWVLDGGLAQPVRSESVEFVGGQGEGPSVGGVFLLEQDGAPAYRLDLPLQPVADRGWDPDA